jgi:hypothetical protein
MFDQIIKNKLYVAIYCTLKIVLMEPSVTIVST